ncbi:13493_t:CDS:1, partial [Ambispora gerdemannii]
PNLSLMEAVLFGFLPPVKGSSSQGLASFGADWLVFLGKKLFHQIKNGSDYQN